MAKNNGMSRIPVKWVRDRAKSAYEKLDQCYICGTDIDLELHHLSSITLLLKKWATAKGYHIDTDEGIIAVRDEFIDEHRKEIYEDVYTLCNKHHVALHGIYGKSPALGTATKQERWINLQKDKLSGKVVVEKRPELSFFSAFT